ncbi:MAG: hypothetical protein WC043_08640 [Pseudobdellovibrionaceae bacterium]
MATPQPRSKKKKKSLIPKKYKKFLWLGGITFLVISYYFLSLPAQGTMGYGVCKVFVELTEPYPQSIKILSVFDFRKKIRMTYKKFDTFGNEQVNEIECYFKIDGAGNITNYLDKVDINGKDRAYIVEDPIFVEKFNKTVPALEANPPDLTLPYYKLEDIKTYKDTDID